MQNLLSVRGYRFKKPVAKGLPLGVVLAVPFCLVAGSRTAAAQAGQQFVGHVEDTSHASISAATVTIHNEDTGKRSSRRRLEPATTPFPTSSRERIP